MHFDFLDYDKCLFFYLNPSDKYSTKDSETTLTSRINYATGLSLKFVQAGNNKESNLKDNLLKKADLEYLKELYKEDYKLIDRVELL